MSELWEPGHGLGRRESYHDAPKTLFDALNLPVPQGIIKKKFDIPHDWRLLYDQGQEGSCVGFGSSWAMSLKNKKTYLAHWLYEEAQKIDPWPETPPEEGTDVHSAMQILITKGHRTLNATVPALKEGIKSVFWANLTNVVNQIRASINHGMPVVQGINWYSNFDQPKWDVKRGWIIGEGELGNIRGGHCTCIYGVDDNLECVNIVNNWGLDYPLVKMPYKTVERLAREGGEFAIITDR